MTWLIIYYNEHAMQSENRKKMTLFGNIILVCIEQIFKIWYEGMSALGI